MVEVRLTYFSTGTHELISIALIKTPEGTNLSAEFLTPVGYHPSIKYWRSNSANPDT